MQYQVSLFGGSQKDALLPMQDYLHAAEKAAKDLGVPLDANTQMMIDQSKELGIWKDKGPDAAKTLQNSIDDLTNAVKTLAEKLGGVKQGLNDLPKHVTTTVHVETEYTHRGDPPTFHTGGLVMHGGGLVDDTLALQRRAIDASLWASAPRAHSGAYLGADEVPIIAQRGEGILSRTGMTTIGGSAGLQAMNSGRGSAGGGLTINNYIDARESIFDNSTADKLAEKIKDNLLGDVLVRRRLSNT